MKPLLIKKEHNKIRKKMGKKSGHIVIVSLFLLTGGLFLYYSKGMDFSAIQTIVAESGVWAPIVFILLYAITIVFFLPGSPLTIAGGLFFGAIWGTVLSLVGAMLGATIAFILARYVASGWVEKHSGQLLQRIIKGITQSGWRFVAVIRLIPILPFAALNYLLGVTSVSFKEFWFATAIFMTPGVFAYAYLGSLGEAFMRGGGKQIVGQAVFGVSFLVLLIALPWLMKITRQDTLLKELEMDNQ